MIYFTADTHFSHTNIIRYCGRPFKTAEEMDEVMIARWNERVGPDDGVIHLGDFAWKSASRWREVRRRLNGDMRLIIGSHDRLHPVLEKMGIDCCLSLYIPGSAFCGKRGGLYLAHEPEYDTSKWQGADHHLCGHVHEHWRRRGNIINVGVDQWDFYPITLEEALGAKDGT